MTIKDIAFVAIVIVLLGGAIVLSIQILDTVQTLVSKIGVQ